MFLRSPFFFPHSRPAAISNMATVRIFPHTAPILSAERKTRPTSGKETNNQFINTPGRTRLDEQTQCVIINQLMEIVQFWNYWSRKMNKLGLISSCVCSFTFFSGSVDVMTGWVCVLAGLNGTSPFRGLISIFLDPGDDYETFTRCFAPRPGNPLSEINCARNYRKLSIFFTPHRGSPRRGSFFRGSCRSGEVVKKISTHLSLADSELPAARKIRKIRTAQLRAYSSRVIRKKKPFSTKSKIESSKLYDFREKFPILIFFVARNFFSATRQFSSPARRTRVARGIRHERRSRGPQKNNPQNFSSQTVENIPTFPGKATLAPAQQKTTLSRTPEAVK